MDDEEVEALLRVLRALLAEFGGRVTGDMEDEVREVPAEVGVRERLSSLLDEYEAILVSAPKMVAWTTTSLEARSIAFAPDHADLRFSRPGGDVLRSDVGGVTITSDALRDWLEVAATASDLLRQARGRLLDRRG